MTTSERATGEFPLTTRGEVEYAIQQHERRAKAWRDMASRAHAEERPRAARDYERSALFNEGEAERIRSVFVRAP